MNTEEHAAAVVRWLADVMTDEFADEPHLALRLNETLRDVAHRIQAGQFSDLPETLR